MSMGPRQGPLNPNKIWCKRLETGKASLVKMGNSVKYGCYGNVIQGFGKPCILKRN